MNKSFILKLGLFFISISSTIFVYAEELEKKNNVKAILNHSIIDNCLSNAKVTDPLSKLCSDCVSNNKVTIVYFFNFMCHHCKNLTPKFYEWEKQHKENFNFVKTPIGYGKSWELVTRVYYTARALNLNTEEFDKKMFDLLSPDEDPESPRIDLKDFYAFFYPYGITYEEFEKTLYSPAIDDMLDYGVNLSLALDSYIVPAIAIIAPEKCYVTNSAKFKDKEGIIDWLNDYVESMNNESQSEKPTEKS